MAISVVDGLLRNLERHLAYPWRQDLSADERVWFLVYPPESERRVRAKLGEFELRITQASRRWILLDLTEAFPAWIAAHQYREAYFETPEDLDEGVLAGFLDHLVESCLGEMATAAADSNTVVAILGVGALFPYVRISNLVPRLAPSIAGRLLVFFPGEYENNNYKLLGARDGWNYLATPITPGEEE